MSLLGLDLGTTGTKAVAFSLDGAVLASAYREYPLLSPRPGWQEIDPEQVWQSVREVLAEVAGKTQSDPIQAMAFSAQGEAFHPVDAQGNPLRNSMVTFDGRCADYPAWWEERISKREMAEITGMPLSAIHTINKIMWIRDNEPDIFNRAAKFLCYEDYIHARLGLEPVMSHSLAARTMCFDVQKGEWSRKVLDIAGISPDLLPKTAPAGTAVGTIPDTVADDIGLPRGIVVSTGGHDQPAGALGSGITKGGEAMYATGTVECICPVFDKFTMTDALIANNLCCYPSCSPPSFASIAFNFTGGSLLRWYRDTFGGADLARAEREGKDVYEVILAGVSPEPENVLVLPHFTMTGTPHFDARSRGAILGLTLQTPREEVVAAILSGVTYEMKYNLRLLQEAGVEIGRVRAIGGGAKSPVWLQRKADILGLPVAVPEVTEAAALGVALLAGLGAGQVPDLAAATDSIVRVGQVLEPDPERAKRFEDRYAVYCELYPALKDINHRIAAW